LYILQGESYASSLRNPNSYYLSTKAADSLSSITKIMVATNWETPQAFGNRDPNERHVWGGGQAHMGVDMYRRLSLPVEGLGLTGERTSQPSVDVALSCV